MTSFIGSNGINGQNPPTEAVDIVDTWNRDFRTVHWSEYGFFATTNLYKVYSQRSIAPGNGGDGGVGGYGGKAGQVLIFGREQTPQFLKFSNDGIYKNILNDFVTVQAGK